MQIMSITPGYWTPARLRAFRQELGVSQSELGQRLAKHRKGDDYNRAYSQGHITGAESGWNDPAKVREAFWTDGFIQSLDSYYMLHTTGKEDSLVSQGTLSRMETLDFIEEGKVFDVGDITQGFQILRVGQLEDDMVIVPGIIPSTAKVRLETCAVENCTNRFQKVVWNHRYCDEHKDPRSRKLTVS
jgi:hypothetical protein